MNASISSIRSALTTNLTAVTEIKQVAVGRSEAMESFPAARHYLLGISDTLQDTNNNYRTYRFGIDIVQLAANDAITKANSEAAFQDAIDAVMDKLIVQWAMASIESSIIEQGIVRYEDAGKGPQLVCTITWSARVLVSLT